jgi:hypothetical protein
VAVEVVPMTGIEEWRPVTIAPGRYEVSNMGRVRSVGLNGRQPRDKSVFLVQGYPKVTLYPAVGQRAMLSVHRLVALAFLGPQPDEKSVVRHLDGNPKNNVTANLAWGTASENMRDAVRHGTHAKTRQTHCKNGHPLSGANVRIRVNGHRRCLECARIRNLARKAVSS